MQIQNEVRFRVETPAHVVRFGMQHGAGFPEQEVRIGIEVIGGGFRDDVHSRKAGMAIFALAMAHRMRTVENDIGMMDDAGVIEAQFKSTNVFCLFETGADDEVAEDIARAGAHLEWLRHAEYYVWLPHLPAVVELRSGREIRGVTARRAGVYPFGQ